MILNEFVLFEGYMYHCQMSADGRISKYESKGMCSNCKFCYSLESKHWLIRKALLARVDLLMECTWQKVFVPASNQDYSSCFNFTQAF